MLTQNNLQDWKALLDVDSAATESDSVAESSHVVVLKEKVDNALRTVRSKCTAFAIGITNVLRWKMLKYLVSWPYLVILQLVHLVGIVNISQIPFLNCLRTPSSLHDGKEAWDSVQVSDQIYKVFVTHQASELFRSKLVRTVSHLFLECRQIPITVTAYVSQMQWPDWLGLLSSLQSTKKAENSTSAGGLIYKVFTTCKVNQLNWNELELMISWLFLEFRPIPITVTAYVSQMQWPDWLEILSSQETYSPHP